MKNLTKTIALLLVAVLVYLPDMMMAQCGAGETYNSYCYDDGEVDVVAFEFCPTAGDIAQSEIIAGSYNNSPFPPAIEGLSVYEGAPGSGTSGTLIFGPADGDLTGTVITASAPDLCLIFISNSNLFNFPTSCLDGFETTLEVCSESLPATTVTFTAPPDLCVDAGVQTGLSGGSPTGGVYSGTGVTDDGNGMTYSFDPAAAGVGVHTLTYTNGGSASDDVEVFADPTFTALADLCIDAGVQTGLGGGSPSGGVYSGNGVTDDGNGMTYSFNPAIAGLGVHTITYTSAAGCSASDDVQVLAACGCPAGQTSHFHCGGGVETNLVVFEVCPTAGMAAQAIIEAGTYTTAGNNLSVYEGPTGSGTSGTLVFGPATGDLAGTVITGLGADQCLIFVNNSPTGLGCQQGFETALEVCGESITPSVSFTALDDLCIDDGVQTGLSGGLPTGGVYSGTGVTDDGNGMTYSFDPVAAGAGVHTLTYTLGGGSDSDDVEVFATGTAGCVDFTAPANLCVDAGVQTGLGGGAPSGGVYSGPGVTDDGNGMTYSFDPAAAGAGVHTLTYTVMGNAATDDVEVFDLPVVTFTAPANVCSNAPPMAYGLLGEPTGGVYSGPGVTDNGNGISFIFNPAVAGVGVHVLIYTYSDANGCTNSASDDIEVIAGAAFTAPADLCVDAGVQAGLGGGTPSGGVYSGPGVTDDGNGMTYSFDPVAAGVGVHTITYDIGFCSPTFASDDIEVFALPTVNFTALADLCENAGVQAGLGGGTPTGGVYSGPGVTDDGNGMTYSFDPDAAGIGVHTLTYTFTDTNGCTNSADDDVEVFIVPDVNFTAPADLCADAGVQAGLGGGTPPGGVYSGAGVTDDGNGMTYSFDPAAAGAGVHTLTYTFTDGNGCTESDSDDIEVFALPVVAFTAPADLCIDAGVQAGLGGGTPTGGVYSGTGVTDDGNGMTYSFDPAAAGIGVHTITYDFTDANGCSGSASDDVEVFDLPMVTLNAALYYCLDAPIQNITLVGGSPVGGVYSGPGVTDNGMGTGYFLDPTVGGPGMITVTYTLTDANGCTNSASRDIDIFDCDVEFTDPCACLDNATVKDLDAMTGGDDGQFSELISVIDANGTGLPSGQIWTITAVSGAFDAGNIPPIGTQSAGVPVSAGTTLNHNAGLGTYELAFVHVDVTGYSITVEGPFGQGSPANSTYVFSNYCQYPDPIFDPALQSQYCPSDPAVTLGGIDQNGAGADPGSPTFTIDGNPATILDPSMLALGPHTVVMTFDGADDGNGGIGTQANPASPGCVQTVQQVVTIVNNPPVINCPPDVDIECDEDTSPANTGIATATDDCAVPTIGFMDVSTQGTTGCDLYRYTITRTWSADDGFNPPVTCVQTINVDDTTPPAEPTPPMDVTVQCAEDVPAPVDLTATDNCAPPITVSPVPDIMPGSCVNQFTMIRTWTFTDPCGNTSSVSQTITVDDTTAPTIQCPADLTVNCLQDVPSPDITLPVTGDNCMAPVTTTHEGDDNNATLCDGGTIIRTYGATDACGNFEECTQVITVNPPAGPTIVCPPDMTVECAADIIVDANDAVVTTACNFGFTSYVTQPDIQGAPDCNGTTYTYTYKTIDDCGRTAECQQVWTIVNDPPEILLPNCGSSNSADPIYDNFTWDSGDNDGSGFGPWQLNPVFGTANAGHFVFTSTENGGMMDTNNDNDVDRTQRAWGFYANSFNLSEAVRPLNQGMETGSTLSLLMDNGWIDNGGTVGFGLRNSNGENVWEFFFIGGNANYSIQDASGTVNTGIGFTDEGLKLEFLQLDATTIRVTVTTLVNGQSQSFISNLINAAGGQTISQIRIFNFNAGMGAERNLYFNSLVVCHPETVECASDIVNDPSNATVTTSCGEELDVTIYSPEIIGDPDCPGALYSYTYRVEDQCEREATVDKVYVIGDNAPPMISAPADVTCTCLAGVNANGANATVTTACDLGFDVAVSGPVISGPIDCPGTTYTYTYTVKDVCGREASDTQVFTVQNEGPQFVNAPTVPLQLNCEDQGWEDIIQAWLANVEATTSCSQPLSVSNNYNPNSQGLCISNGTTMVTFTAQDQCGRSAQTTGMIIIADTEPPVFVEEAQDELDICNYNTPAEFDEWVDAHGNALALDGCWGDQLSWSTIPNNPQFPNCMGVMGATSVTVTFVARDGCGNKASSTATFTALMSGGDFGENEGDVQTVTDLGFSLYQNQPNPFRNETLISFSLPQASSATLTIYDISGRVIKEVEGDYSEGYNEVQLSRSELGSPGMLYYELKTSTDQAVMKMILLD